MSTYKNKYREAITCEKRIRASKVYTDWVHLNKAVCCLKCDSTEHTEVHHTTKLNHIIDGAWKLYGDWEATFTHVIQQHADDVVDNITLCRECHKKIHPGRSSINPIEPRHLALWCALPRHLGIAFRQGTKSRERTHSIGLVGFQALIGIGWYVMNHGLNNNTVSFNRRKLAKLLGKAAGTSFNTSLSSSLYSLVQPNIVEFFEREGNNYSVLLSDAYVERMDENPWFFPLEDASTSRMLVLTLRWWLSHQSNRRRYSISRAKLVGHLGIQTPSPAWTDKAVMTAVKEISSATLSIDGDIYNFTLKPRGATPIHQLRGILSESL